MSLWVNAQRLIAALVVALSTTAAFSEEKVLGADAFSVFSEDFVAAGGRGEVTQGFVATEAGQLHYVAAGEGPTIVLYHGFPSFWYAWKTVIPALSKHFRVIALDGLGANLSAKPTDLSYYKVSALAAQLERVIEELNAGEPVYIVGHDWGAALVWAFAQAHPEQVLGLAAISAPPLNMFLHLLSTEPEQQRASSYVKRLKKMVADNDYPADAPTRITQLGYSRLLREGLISQRDYDAFAIGLAQSGALRGGTSWYAANVPEVGEISSADQWPSADASALMPTLVIWGESDGTFIPKFLDLAPEYAEPVQIETLPGVGHWPMFEAADECRELLVDFFRSLAGI